MRLTRRASTQTSRLLDLAVCHSQDPCYPRTDRLIAGNGHVRDAPVLNDVAHDVAHDFDMEGLSLYEKKSLLIQRELDAMGMGNYQWYIWSLCGLGYFLDLLWAQAFGLIATPLQKELGFNGMSDRNLE